MVLVIWWCSASFSCLQSRSLLGICHFQLLHKRETKDSAFKAKRNEVGAGNRYPKKQGIFFLLECRLFVTLTGHLFWGQKIQCAGNQEWKNNRVFCAFQTKFCRTKWKNHYQNLGSEMGCHSPLPRKKHVWQDHPEQRECLLLAWLMVWLNPGWHLL